MKTKLETFKEFVPQERDSKLVLVLDELANDELVVKYFDHKLFGSFTQTYADFVCSAPNTSRIVVVEDPHDKARKELLESGANLAALLFALGRTSASKKFLKVIEMFEKDEA